MAGARRIEPVAPTVLLRSAAGVPRQTESFCTNLMAAVQSVSLVMGLALKLITAVLLLLAAFVTFRVFVRRDYRKKGRLTPFSSFLQLLLFFLHAMSSYVYLGSAQVGKDSLFFVLAILLMAAGLVLTGIAMANLGVGDVIGLTAAGLRTSGFYRYIRNPQIVTCSFFYIGCAILWPSWTGLIWLGLLWVMLPMMVLTEEEHLRRKFGEEYRRYCEETPRYFGFRKT
jgi:protein-S-isoprenylcysteine O-methyltransferase Ste14